MKRSREEIKADIEKALRVDFPHDTVDITDGYHDNIHVLVVSRRFDGKVNAYKDDWLWDIIKKSGLTEEEQKLISVVLPISPAEIK